MRKAGVAEIRSAAGSHDSRQFDDGFGADFAEFGQLALLVSVLG